MKQCIVFRLSVSNNYCLLIVEFTLTNITHVQNHQQSSVLIYKRTFFPNQNWGIQCAVDWYLNLRIYFVHNFILFMWASIFNFKTYFPAFLQKESILTYFFLFFWFLESLWYTHFQKCRMYQSDSFEEIRNIDINCRYVSTVNI